MQAPRIAFGQQRFEEELAAIQAMSQRHVEQMEVDHTEFGTIKVFNVHEKDQLIPMGGLSSFYIPPCPKDRVYSRPLEIWKQFPEGRTDDMKKLSMRTLDGYLIAESVVGYGQGFAPEYGLRKLGVFTCGAYVTMELPDDGCEETIRASEVAAYKKKQRGAKAMLTREATPNAIKAFRKSYDPKTWKNFQWDQTEAFYAGLKQDKDIAAAIVAGELPTEEEIDSANDLLTKYAQEQVTLANSFYAAGNMIEATQPPYLWAAKRTGNTKLPWATGVVMMTACTWCQSPINPEAILCLACGNIAPGKEQLVIEARLPKFAHLWQHLENKPAEKSAK